MVIVYTANCDYRVYGIRYTVLFMRRFVVSISSIPVIRLAISFCVVSVNEEITNQKEVTLRLILLGGD